MKIADFGENGKFAENANFGNFEAQIADAVGLSQQAVNVYLVVGGVTSAVLV